MTVTEVFDRIWLVLNIVTVGTLLVTLVVA